MHTSPSVTEIMCTLTASQVSEDASLLRAMYDAGMRGVRVNTAHLRGVGQLHLMAQSLKETLPGIRLLIDTKGPEMRTTSVADDGEIFLADGAEVLIRGCADDTPTSPGRIYVNYPDIHTEPVSGRELMIDDGKIVLSAVAVDGDGVLAKVTKGGALGSRKGVSVAGVDLRLPPLSRLDREYISYAASSPYIDAVAHSFVRSADDVLAVRAAMGDGHKPIIAKIENRQGIDALDDIISVCDGILIARGDLTACIGRAAVPGAQSVIACAAVAAGRPLYLATGILSSMMRSPAPSAEDLRGIALAMSQGVDVMLLTNETASGDYPVECVRALRCALDRGL